MDTDTAKQRIPKDAFSRYALYNKSKTERFTLLMRTWQSERLDIEAKERGMRRGDYILAILDDRWDKEDTQQARQEAQQPRQPQNAPEALGGCQIASESILAHQNGQEALGSPQNGRPCAA